MHISCAYILFVQLTVRASNSKKGRTLHSRNTETHIHRSPCPVTASCFCSVSFWHYTVNAVGAIDSTSNARVVTVHARSQACTVRWFQLCSEQSGGSLRLPVAVLSTWPRGNPGNSFRCCQRKLFSFWTGAVRARSSCFTKYVKSSLVSRCPLLRDWRSRVVFRGWKSRSNMMPSRGSVRSMCPEALRWKFLAFLWMSVFALSDVMCQETRTSECYYGKPDNVTGCLCDPGFSGTSCNRCAGRSR